ncbi:MAG: DUF4339 domain-containing protein [Chloroflexi bacterium]|nr:DUF4339 domain-containing protein [Chloroflexota bacterium]
MAANQFWYADSNGVTCGPFDGKQLKQLAATGIITAETQVYAAHTQKWVPARRVKGLLPTIVVQPSRPPPVPALPQSIPARKKAALSNTQIACLAAVCVPFILCLGLCSGLGTPSTLNEGPRPNDQRAEEPDPEPNDEPDGLTAKIDAWVYAQSFVKANLKSPSTAKFSEGLLDFSQNAEDNVRYVGNGLYSVHGWVDSQNSFGGTMRTNWVVELQSTDEGNWSVADGPRFSE